jgi:hypothetical protein
MVDNVEVQGVTLFWQLTEEWQNLNETWSYYQPYIRDRINNTE